MAAALPSPGWGLSNELPRAGWGLKRLSCSLLRKKIPRPLFCGYNQATASSGVSSRTPMHSAEPGRPRARTELGRHGKTPSSANRSGLCSGKQSWRGVIGAAAEGESKRQESISETKCSGC